MCKTAAIGWRYHVVIRWLWFHAAGIQMLMFAETTAHSALLLLLLLVPSQLTRCAKPVSFEIVSPAASMMDITRSTV